MGLSFCPGKTLRIKTQTSQNRFGSGLVLQYHILKLARKLSCAVVSYCSQIWGSVSTVFREALETKGERRSGGGARWLWVLAGSILIAALQPFPPPPLGALPMGWHWPAGLYLVGTDERGGGEIQIFWIPAAAVNLNPYEIELVRENMLQYKIHKQTKPTRGSPSCTFSPRGDLACRGLCEHWFSVY